MISIAQAININLNELLTASNEAEKRIKNSPDGYLVINKNKSGEYYSRCFYDEGTEKYTHQSISKRHNIEAAAALAEKKYCRQLLPEIKKQIKAYEYLLKNTGDGFPDKAYNSIPPELRQYISPVIMSEEAARRARVNERLNWWNSRTLKFNSLFPERLIFETEYGEKRRSKSEALISDRLDRHSDTLLYNYEPQLHIEGKIICPDFEILNCETGDYFLWEHFGGMHLDKYTDNMVNKIRLYRSAGFNIDRNLILTFETADCPLSPADIDYAINILLGRK